MTGPRRNLAILAFCLLAAVIFAGYFLFQASRPSMELTQTAWRLEAVELEGVRLVPPLPPAQRIQVAGGPSSQIQGFDGCNSFSGPLRYSPVDGSFRVDPDAFRQTAMACETIVATASPGHPPRALHNDEIQTGLSFHSLLFKMARYEIAGGRLRLASPDGRQVMLFTPAAPQP